MHHKVTSSPFKEKKRSLAHDLHFCSHGALYKRTTTITVVEQNEWASDDNDKYLLPDITQILENMLRSKTHQGKHDMLNC